MLFFDHVSLVGSGGRVAAIVAMAEREKKKRKKIILNMSVFTFTANNEMSARQPNILQFIQSKTLAPNRDSGNGPSPHAKLMSSLSEATQHIYKEAKKLEQDAQRRKAPAPAATEISEVLRREMRASHSISEFTVSVPKQPSVKPLVERPLNEQESAFAQCAATRILDAREGYLCGNSPFCVDKSHNHDADDTALGRLERRVRRSSESRLRIAMARSGVCAPAYPYDARSYGSEIRIPATPTPTNQMSNADFCAGVQRGDLAYLILAIMRVYHGELQNITDTALADTAAIHARGSRQERELLLDDAPTLRSVAGALVWGTAEAETSAVKTRAVDKMRVLECATSIEVLRLLQQQRVERANVLHAALMQFISDSVYNRVQETDVIERLRSIVRTASDSGPFFENGFTTRPWVLDLSDDDDDDDIVGYNPLSDAKRRRQTGATNPNANSSSNSKVDGGKDSSAPSQETILCNAVCPSQFCYGPRVFACSSISVNSLVMLARADQKAAENGVDTLSFIHKCIGWTRVVEIGIDWWNTRLDKSHQFENIDDIVNSSPHSPFLKEAFEIIQFDGPLFDERALPTTEEERIRFIDCPDIETALRRCQETFGGRPFACAVSAGNSTISLSCHAHGWHVFDSHGSTVADRSVLFTLVSLADTVALVKHLLRAEERDPTKNVGMKRKLSVTDQMENVQYLLLAASAKKESAK